MRHTWLVAMLAFCFSGSNADAQNTARVRAMLLMPAQAAQAAPASPAALKRPEYCPLPEVITMDKDSEQPDKLAIWTGIWEANNAAKFCFVVTSIKNGKVSGIYSMQNLFGDREHFYVVEGTAKAGPSSTKLRTGVKERDWQFTFDLANDGSGRATWSGLSEHTRRLGRPFTVTATVTKFQ